MQAFSQRAALAAVLLNALVGCQGYIGPSRAGEENALGPRAGDHGSAGSAGNSGGRSGSSGNGGGSGGAGAPSCDVPEVADSSLKRLTDTQYRNSVRDIFRGVLAPTIGLPPSQANLSRTGLTAEPGANVVSASGATRIVDSAEELGLQVTEQLEALLPCYPNSQDRACAEEFVSRYGRAAFRRPLDGDERDALLGVYDSAGDLSFAERVGLMTSALLQMPQFLYVIEEGEPVAGDERLRRLSGYEIAARLSLLFWDSAPDADLLAAAADGELDNIEGIETHARRLLDSDVARPTMRRFLYEWMQVHETADKDQSVYPGFNRELAASFRRELEHYFDRVLDDENATPATLLTSNQGSVNSLMANFFDMEGASTGVNDWQSVTLPPERSGLLTRPALLAGLSYPADSAPIHRGKFVLSRLLCVELQTPPADALARQPEVPVNASQRVRSDARREVDECGGCHDFIDPLGLGLEELDGIGQYRSEYVDGSPVDTTGEIFASVDVRGPFQGAMELTELLAESEDVRACAARQWFRYAMSRIDTRQDACSYNALVDDFEAENYSLRELFIAVTRTDAFRFRRVKESQ